MRKRVVVSSRKSWITEQKIFGQFERYCSKNVCDTSYKGQIDFDDIFGCTLFEKIRYIICVMKKKRNGTTIHANLSMTNKTLVKQADAALRLINAYVLTCGGDEIKEVGTLRQLWSKIPYLYENQDYCEVGPYPWGIMALELVVVRTF